MLYILRTYSFYLKNKRRVLWGFPCSSAGKESACNAGDPSSIPGLGRSAWEGISYSLQYYWASLVAQLVKNPPATQETWVQSLGWEDPLEKGRLPTPVFWPEEVHDCIVHGVAKSQTRLSDFYFTMIVFNLYFSVAKRVEFFHIVLSRLFSLIDN